VILKWPPSLLPRAASRLTIINTTAAVKPEALASARISVSFTVRHMNSSSSNRLQTGDARIAIDVAQN
jgi:hypothetical protein